MTASTLIVYGALAWLAVGLLVALPFAVIRLKSFDAVAGRAPWRVRLLFVPGLAALWPLTLQWWLARSKPGQSSHADSEERTGDGA